MRPTTKMHLFVTLLISFCLLIAPVATFAKKGDQHYKKGLQYEAAQQWEKAAQEFTLAVAADPSSMEYQLHFRRASFNASQMYMQQGRALAEQRDYVGAYNSFRQAFGFDPVNELAVSEMERMLRLQSVKEGTNGSGSGAANGSKSSELQDSSSIVPLSGQAQEAAPPPAHTEQLRIISYSGDLKAFIRSLAEQLTLNVVFDRQSFAQTRTIDINLRDVTTAQALDYIFLQEGLFFQKLSRRTILVADQTRRPQYQQLVLRTFFLSNIAPEDARTLVQQAIPPSVGRPQTIVVPDKATNSLTVRDTAENVRLIGELLQSIDKDRAEVVMDVNIYEVSRSDLMQLGNQIGQPGSDGVFHLGGSPGFAALTGNGTLNNNPGVNLSSLVGGVPTAAAAALVIPSAILTAFQRKNNTKLIASTQIHAFNGEESTARIGQRVPVQTAQAYPFGIQTGQASNAPGQFNFPTGGFPVINYEPTGLTLKFTPQVFPNLDVQVKMNIESKDVLGAQTATPTFTERTISGTARIQNNRTMMLASVSTNVESRGRQGLPVLGLIPVLGRLFTSPTRDNRQVDIVIAVTPRVLRAPAVTPRDEEMRPSGTLQSPTTGSLEAMMREAEREDQLAAARRLPTHATVQLPDVEPAPFAPAARSEGNEIARSTSPQSGSLNPTAGKAIAVPPPTNNEVSRNVGVAGTVATVPVVNSQTQARQSAKVQAAVEEPPAFVPAPKSLISDRSAAAVAAVNPGSVGSTANTNALLTSLPRPIETSAKAGPSRVVQLRITPVDQTLKVGWWRRFAVELNSDVPLDLAVLTLRFDPKVVKVRAVNPGTLGSGGNEAPIITRSIDPNGVCLISVSNLSGAPPMKGTGVLVFFELEGTMTGDAALTLDKDATHLVAIDGRDVVMGVSQGRIKVMQ
jgi:general secretion pathway protein D